MFKILLVFIMVSISFSNPIIRIGEKILKPKKLKKIKKTNSFKYKKFGITKLNNYKKTNLQRRRITKLEKRLLHSKYAKKQKFNGRVVVKRRVFKCSPANIARMKKGKAPIGFDGKPVNLHHLKQQQMGELVELSSYEHNKHSKILHRYTKTTEISDRNNGFAKFRSDWWRNRVGDCKRKSF